MTEQLAEILTKIRNNYSGERFAQTEKNAQITIENFSNAMDKLKSGNVDFFNNSNAEENWCEDEF